MVPLRRPAPLPRLNATQSFVHARQRIRNFHASPSRHGTIAELPHTLFVFSHDLGLSWAQAIPLAAISIRCFIILPFFTIPSHLTAHKLSELSPMVSASGPRIRQLIEEAAQKNPSLGSLAALYKKKRREKYKSLLKSNGIKAGALMRYRQFLQIPIFLWVLETMRRMLGMGQGLITTLVSGSMFSEKTTPDMTESNSTSGIVLDTGATSQLEDSVSNTWYEPSMATEGPWWIVDLTAPDPTLCLPFIVSGLVYASIRFGTNNATIGLQKSTFSRRLNNMLLFGSLMIGPLTLHLPAGFLYYWACTSASGLAASVFLRWRWPPRKVVEACRRPFPKEFAKNINNN